MLHRSLTSLTGGLSLSLILAISAGARAAESDQYTNRQVAVEDSLETLDTLLNEELRLIAEEWRGAKNEALFVKRVYKKIAGFYWVDRFERMVIASPVIDKLPQSADAHIFSGLPFRVSRVVAFFGVSPTVKANEVLVGTDKFTHFFSHGARYYLRWHKGRPLRKVLSGGAKSERWMFGKLTTGVHSNADLVANYEGFRFYRSLFEDGIIRGKKAILRWDGDRVFMQRLFTWKNHINPYWDEVLNPPGMSSSLRGYVSRRLGAMCSVYRRHPQAFSPPSGHERLRAHYANLHLTRRGLVSLDEICRAQEADSDSRLARGVHVSGLSGREVGASHERLRNALVPLPPRPAATLAAP